MPIIHAVVGRARRERGSLLRCGRTLRRIFVAVVLLAPFMARAAKPDDVVGDWLVASRDAVIRIADHNGTFDGSLVWLLHPTYGPEDGAKAGLVVVDSENPDPALRTRALLGLTILTGLRFDGEDAWSGGHVYNTDNGKTYGAEITMLGPDRLKMRGFIGIPLLGGSTQWTRVRQIPPPL